MKIASKCLVVMLFVITGAAYSSDFTEKNSDRPNILFIVVDDLKPLLGTYGDNKIYTPSIDRLASRGVVFTNNYCQQAVCAPSRIRAFTGLAPGQKKGWNENPEWMKLPQFLRANGIITAGLGKLMNGAKNNDPLSWSIPYKPDSELTYAEGFSYPANGKYQSVEIHKAVSEAKSKNLDWKETNLYLKELDLSPSTEYLDLPDNAYEDGAIADEGIRLMRKMKRDKKPFFLALGFHKPHLPFAAPKKYWDLYEREHISLSPFMNHAQGSPAYAYHTWGELRNYSDIPERGQLLPEKQKEIIHGYMASVSYVDAQIGKVVDELISLGLAENTIIILWGDHGWHLGDHGLWCKHSNFEQAVRSPLIIAAPGRKSGAKAGTISELVDIYPTVCELAGLEIPEILEGNSLAAALTDTALELKNYAVSQFPRGNNRMGYSLRSQRYRLTAWFKGPFREGNTVLEENIEAIELYDYLNDPNETISLYNDPAYNDIKEKLLTELIKIIN